MEMVVSASTGAMQALLPKLGKILTDEYNLHKGVKEGIRYIQEELERMQAALEKVSKVPPEQLDEPVKLWARKLREMSYDIEDTIDSYMVRVDSAGEFISSKSCCINMKGMLPVYKSRRSIAIEIDRIKKEVKEVSQRHERYRADHIVVAPPQRIDPRLPTLYSSVTNHVGIDSSREELINFLSIEGSDALKQKPKLVSIVGPGGIGKTTLANAVYQKLQGQFDCRAFVSVSLNPNIKHVLASILRQVSQQNYEGLESWQDNEVMDKIRQFLKKKEVYSSIKLLLSNDKKLLQFTILARYFIIIDDIWDESAWQLVKCVLIDNSRCSKIITTTRNIDVAKSCCSSDNIDGIIHKLQPLSIADSEKLFYCKVFDKERCPPELTEISQKILKRCGGLPLAIITIASLFANRQTQTEDHWNSLCNSIHTGLESNRNVKDMRWILSLSYCDLPSHLKTCFLYLSIFPEDHNIERDDLIWRWIAEGFVHPKQDKNLYEQGESYFNELINRSLIQPICVDTHGRAQACRVHDMVLEFIISLSSEEKFVTILNGQNPVSDLPNKIYRLSLQNSKYDRTISQKTMSLPHVRTLAVFWHGIDLKLPLSSFLVLRVLDLEDCISHNIEGIGSLVHLKYLRLSCTQCTELPKEIGNLQFLQALDIKGADTKELPSTVVQLRKLVRLSVHTRAKLPDGIGNMESLDELSEIDISRYPNLLEELGNLSKLRVLEISLGAWDKRYEEPFLECVCNLKKLQIFHIFATSVSLDFMLEVAWAPRHLRRFAACVHRQTERIFNLSPSSAWSEISPFSTLPRWIDSSLSNLSDLSIMVKVLRQEDLEILGGLPALNSLDLHVIEATKERLEITSCTGANRAINFWCLVNFRFASRALGLVFRQGAMQRLQMLSLVFRLRWTKNVHGDLDLGFENLTSLTAVDVGIDCCSAWLWEVQVAEAAMRNSTNLNPNHPTLDLSRHFQREMLWEGMEEIPELETMKELVGLAKMGPWGGNRGRPHDIKVAPHRMESVTICSCIVIDSLAFSYSDHDGQRHTVGPWGGYGGSEHTIQLGPSEFLMEVSGTIGPFHGSPNVITSLTFVTNVGSYGPFGQGGGTPFHIPVQSNGSIVGFFGRSGWYVDAIGVYVNPKLKTMKDDETRLAKIGPWGGNGGIVHDIEVTPHRLESVIICSGTVVDSLAFSYNDHDGQNHTAGPWGGHGGSSQKIHLGPSEILTGVSGTIGPFGASSDVIMSLIIVTNARSYGPFGGGGGRPFHTPVQSNGSIVGFFGRAALYVNAIGVHVNPDLEIMNEEFCTQAGLAKIGPWGGNGGMPHDIKVASQRLESVTICSGIVIDSLAFSYIDHHGQQHTAGPWGGLGGSKYTIQLSPSEFLTKVSGTIGPFGSDPSIITSLTFVTNESSYGPFGQGGGIPFNTPIHSNGCIVGFFGRAGLYVDAVGFYVNSRFEILKEEETGLTKIGPWGGNGGMPHDIKVTSHRLESVTICSGTVVDSLAFSYSGYNGHQHSVGPWGGRHGGSDYNTIQLGPSEFLMKVSGTIGPIGPNPSVITSLTFVTNESSHGPFGRGGGTPFHTPLQSNGSIVGFFARTRWHVDAIGFYVRPF